MMRCPFILIFCLQVWWLNAQTPVISRVEPYRYYPKQVVLISGEGFGTNASNIQVWFGPVKGSILEISNQSIKVEVPAGTRHSNVNVINTQNGLQARSPLKSLSSFSGTNLSLSDFAAPIRFSGSNDFYDLCVCDFDNDGKPDVGATKFANATDLLVLKNVSTPGNISFTQFDKTNVSSLDIGITTSFINCADLDGDGRPDLIASRSGGTRNVFVALRNTSTTTISFAPAQSFLLDIGNVAGVIEVRDLNMDGKPEIILSNPFNNSTLYVFRNTSTPGNISFASEPVKIVVTGMGTILGLEAQDLNGDGKPDLVLTPQLTGDIFILTNQSAGNTISFSAPQRITLSSDTPNLLTLADLNNDDKLDIIFTNYQRQRINILYNQSTESTIAFSASSIVATGAQPWTLDVGDLDGDGDPDLVVTTLNNNGVDILLHDGNYSSPGFTRLTLPNNRNSRAVKVFDIDGDAKPDIVSSGVVGTTTFSIDIWRNRHCYEPKILNSLSLVICPGQTIKLESVPNPGANFEWFKNGTSAKTGTDAFLEITEHGTYHVIATSESGACEKISVDIVVTEGTGNVPQNPAISSNSPVCAASNIQLNAPSVSGGTYSWTGPGGYTSSDQNPVITNAGSGNAGSYSLVVDVGGCKSNTVSIVVEVIDFPNLAIASSGGASICQGASTTLSSSNLSGATYQWFRDGNEISGQTAFTLSATQAGSYTVRVTRPPGCTATSQAFALSTFTPPIASFNAPDIACTGQEISFTNTSTVDANATVVYAWTFATGSTSSEQDPRFTYTTAGARNVVLSITYTGVPGCTSSANKSIDVVAAQQPVIAPSGERACPDEEITLTVSGNFTSYQWSTNATTANITITGPGTFSLSTRDQNNCPGTDDITIGAKTVPELNIIAGANEVSPGTEVQLNVSGADTYEWSPAETLDNPFIANPVARPIETTMYKVIGTIIGECSATDSIEIVVTGPRIIRIAARKVFSPNNDGIDDFWFIDGIERYQDCTLNIFDGRGRRVHETLGYNNDWNAEIGGSPLPQGTYFFVLGCPDGSKATGSVLVVR